ncbi:PLP-dependent aminotransferase family protein [Marinibaculum pumilum]|uniref:PLP-dependent aminotransferase family protein n=1 Tax=Marinibaculum pumilum TaxID=1766165 RepID=A0ABV7KUH9_9PROT
MRLTSPWTARLADIDGSASERLVAALEEDIVAGRLPAGARLPAHRDLAWRLGIAVATVTKAYRQLERRGLVASMRGRATFVADAPPHAREMVDLATNVPPLALSDRLLSATLTDLAKRLDAARFGTYMPPAGSAGHRAALARWLGAGRFAVDADRLLLCNGAQHALSIALAASCPPGTPLLTEALTYPGAVLLARLNGWPLHGLPVDGQGLRPDGLRDRLAALAGRGPKPVLYLTPTLHNPTAATMGAARRREIAVLCRRHDLTIVEDDVYGALAPDAPPPLAALAPERVLHVTGLSKCLSPGLRIGALLAPQPMLGACLAALQASCTMAAPLSCLIMERWLLDGTADGVCAAVRREAAHRTGLAAAALDLPAPARPGFHLWLPMPAPAARRLREAAMTAGLLLGDPDSMTAAGDDTTATTGLRICLGSPAVESLQAAIDQLAVLRERSVDASPAGRALV